MRHRRVLPFGAEIEENGVRFRIWAPGPAEMKLVVDGAERALRREPGGWRSAFVKGACAGSRYFYRVGDLAVPDPASRFQPDDVAGPSAVIDPASFRWSDQGWPGRPWEEAVIYEAHVGAATPEGTFAALADMLPRLAELGVTALELMPVNDFPGQRNWGYDGVLPFAPDSSYGTPDDLKRLIDRAHGLGLMVFLDVVYNHFGPTGNYLPAYAPGFFTERHQTPWGAGLNLDGEDARPVRDFFIENALFWIEEYRFDGLRFDAVHALLDDSEEHIIAELGRRIREIAPARHVHLVLENERNEARWLERDPAGAPTLHTAQWNDDFHHCWHTLLTGESESYYGDFAHDPIDCLERALRDGFTYQGQPSRHAGGKPRGESSGHLPPSAFVSFLQNHDQIGNRAFGDRLAAAPERLALARAALLLSPQIPMLFMGEEWGASTPFQFFVDFSDDPALSAAVRDGRRREFRTFAAFAHPVAAATIPDPTARDTFRASVLAPPERERPPHSDILADTRRLLALRREEVVPLTRRAYLGATSSRPAEGALAVTWRYEGGELGFVVNLGESPMTARLGPGHRPIWISPEVRRERPVFALPPWTGLFSRTALA